MATTLIDTLRTLLGTEFVLTGQAAAPYCKDQRGNYSGTALAVVLPADTLQVSAVVAFCDTNKVSVIPQGGNTSLCGGAVPLGREKSL